MAGYSNIFTRAFDGTGTDTFKTVAGDYFIVLSSAANVAITAVDVNGSPIGNFPVVGQGDSWKSIDQNGLPLRFGQLQINSAVAQTLIIFVGTGKFSKGGLTGSVSVLGGNISPTLSTFAVPVGKDLETSNLEAFSASCVQNANIGNFSGCQLFNMVGSGKNVYVDEIIIGVSTVASNVYVSEYDIALATLYQYAYKKSFSTSFQQSTTTQTRSAAFPLLGNIFTILSLNTTSLTIYKPRNPFLLPPGTGLMVQCATANSNLDVSFSGREM